ncbi:MAG: transcriptional repressor [Lachnospiraceae bacterium]|nr:transcriptional repressor [Lachnospiraceae bacterium]
MAERKTYTTKTRTEILEYLKQNWSVTVSVSDIKKHLEEKEIKANTTTIYRYLDKLLAEHVIIKYADKGMERAVYQYSGETGHCVTHLHLKCVKCGKIFHLDCGFMDEIRDHLMKNHHFRLLCEGDLLHGICGDCDKEMKDK